MFAVDVSLSLPFTNPVLVFALAMAIFLVAPHLVERYRVPGMVGVIVAGAIVGPHGLNLLDRGPTIVLLGTVGLIYLMFLAGVEIDLHGFRRHRGHHGRVRLEELGQVEQQVERGGLHLIA